MQVPTLDDLPDPSGKSVLFRADFNVPMHDDGTIADDLRIRAAVPSLEWLTSRGAHVTACTHFGRPKGKPDPKYSVAPIRARLAELAPGVELLENLRFDPGEEANDDGFADRLVVGHDLYVNDAFGASHRAHASIVGPPARIPSAAGLLLAKEVEVLGGLLDSPKRPFVAILGGAKVSDKLGVINALLDKVDRLVIGGAMCFTFFMAMGRQVGDSLVEPDRVDECKFLLERAGDKLLLPSDITALGPQDDVRQVGQSIPPEYKGLDIGPGSAAEFTDAISEGRTVFWNGPMGVFEDERFAAGTRTVAHAVAECRGFTVVGGGDVVNAVNQFGLAAEIDHVSTGGGASLELIEQGDLPGLVALRKAPNAH